MTLRLDYGFSEEDLKVTDFATGSELEEELQWFLNNPKGEDGAIDEEEWERVARHAVLLYDKEKGAYSFGDCLHQAIIWERG